MNRSTLTKICIATLTIITLSSCATQSRQRSLDIDSQVTWSEYLKHSGLLGTNSSNVKVDLQWWRAYQHPELNRLIEQALEQNLSVKMIESRIREARAAQSAELAALNPQLSLDASAVDQQLSENGVLPVRNIPGFEIKQTVYQANFDASWELDLFGRKPKRRALAQARYDSTVDLQRDLQLLIVAEVARVYFVMEQVDKQKQLLSQRQILQAEVVSAMQKKWQAGDASIGELDQERLNLAKLAAQEPPLITQYRQLETRLSVLLGQANYRLQHAPKTTATEPDLTRLAAQQLAGTTSDLLRQRYDVRNAERQYIIALQRADLAKLAVYPTFRLFGALGPETVELDRLFDSESLAINLGGLIQWPLYLGGQLVAQSNIAKEQLLQAELAYREQVLLALHDVESQSTQLIETARVLKNQQAIVDLQEHAVQRHSIRYQAGAIDLISLLKVKQALLAEQHQLFNQQSALQQASVAFNKSLGGGWRLFSTPERP